MKRATHDHHYLSVLMSMIVALGSILSATAWAAPEAIGNLAEAQGRVELNGAVVHAGAELRLGMRVVTGPESRAVLRFADGQIVALKSESVFWIKDYRYANNKPAESRSATELLKGGMRFISGAIARENPEAVRIDTPVATIGIRGTEFTAVLGSLCMMVYEGAITVTAAGKTVIASAGQIVFIPDANTPPQFMPAPELRSFCAAPPKGAVPTPTMAVGCGCLALLKTEPAGVVLTPTVEAGAAAAAVIGAIIVEEVNKDDQRASP
jgi:hypothetical protein